MAARHKAPTAVTLAPLAEKSAFERTLERYWIPILAILGLTCAFVVYRNYRGHSERKQRDGSWEKLLASTQTAPFPKIPVADLPVLAGLASELEKTAAGPWARLVQAENAIGQQDYAAAKQALEQLRAGYPKHPLVAEAVPLEGESGPRTIVDHMLASIEVQRVWDEEIERRAANPPPPESAPRVRLKTDLGEIVVALYLEQAPKHAENFLKLAREGFYDGTKFHRVVPGFMIQGGDPNTKEGDPSTWGQGGPGYKVERENNKLLHEAGVLAMAKQGNDVESSGSQFFLTSDPAHHLDGRHVVFGKVIEGLDLVRQIACSPRVAGSERPEAPVTIVSAVTL